MEPGELAAHLRTVPEAPGPARPGPDQPRAADPAPEIGSGIPGLTPPISRRRSKGLVTPAPVELGFVSDDRARKAIEEARTAGRPPERLLLEQGAITGDQLSRTIAERYG